MDESSGDCPTCGQSLPAKRVCSNESVFKTVGCGQKMTFDEATEHKHDGDILQEWWLRESKKHEPARERTEGA
jgi:hypothetical protein